MSHSYVNQLIHIMWSTQDQRYLVSPPLKIELHAYIIELVKTKNGKVFSVGGSSDHIHMAILLPPDISIAELLGHIKAYSSKWIKSRESIDPDFCWQNGYLAISTQADRLDNVCNYIRSDGARHLSKSYIDELIDMLRMQNIEYHEKYFAQNSFSKVLIHAVWSTHQRYPFLNKDIHPTMCNKISEIVKNNRGKVHAIDGIEDHVHLLMEMPRDISLADMMRNVKTKAAHWIKVNGGIDCQNFEWQTGYGAFTVSLTGMDEVKNYILNQEEHHRKKTFQEEWNEFLLKNGILTL